MQVLVDNFHTIRYDGKEQSEQTRSFEKNSRNILISHDNDMHCTHGIMRDVGGSFWEMCTNQLKIALVLYKKWILPVQETASGGRCGFFLAAFSRLASACPNDRVSQGVFSTFKGS